MMKKVARSTVCLCVFLSVGFAIARSLDETDSSKKKPPGDADSRAITAQEWDNKVLRAKDVVLVDFWATWCGPCREMKPIVKALAKDFSVLMVDVDLNERLAVRNDVEALPTLLIFKDGKVARRIRGLTSEKALRKAMEDVRKGS